MLFPIFKKHRKHFCKRNIILCVPFAVTRCTKVQFHTFKTSSGCNWAQILVDNASNNKVAFNTIHQQNSIQFSKSPKKSNSFFYCMLLVNATARNRMTKFYYTEWQTTCAKLTPKIQHVHQIRYMENRRLDIHRNTRIVCTTVASKE